MEADFSKIVHWNFLKLLGHVTIINMHFPMKQIFKWMHEYRENAKMVEGDGGQFLGNYALEFAEIALACYHHPYASPPETS